MTTPHRSSRAKARAEIQRVDVIPGLHSSRQVGTRSPWATICRRYAARWRGIARMSIWVRKTERTGRRSLYLLDVPWELAVLLVGILIMLLVLLLRRLF